MIETAEFENAQDAYEWFHQIEVPSHVIGYRMEVDQDGQWTMFDQTDGADSTRRSAR
ncbi:hypothetical protein ACFOJ6_22165 [Gordonia humi]|uniref:hypothetical protein n=1 Tax=Gordonia humi TaxID=686429 RepID=UPI003616FAC8